MAEQELKQQKRMVSLRSGKSLVKAPRDHEAAQEDPAAPSNFALQDMKHRHETDATHAINGGHAFPPSCNDATPPFDECEERRTEFVMSAHLCGHDELYPEIKHMVQSTNIDFINHMKNCLNCLPIYQANKDKIKALKHSNTYENPKKVVEILSLICQKLEAN